MRLRNKFWETIIRGYPEGELLNFWRFVVKCVLFPIDTFYWLMSKQRGYQPMRDTWIIEGIEYSAKALRWMAHADGETYRIVSDGKVVSMERVVMIEEMGKIKGVVAL